MADSLNLSTTPLFISASDDAEVTIVNGGPGTVYYKTTNDVSSSSNDGSIAAGASLQSRAPKYIVSTTITKVFVERTAESADTTNRHGVADFADIAVLNEFINVKASAYGCVGDGTTDDTTAFTAALTAAAAATSAGGKVVAPPGTYLLDGEIAFDQFVSFEGAGARECTLKMNDAASRVLFNEYGGGTNSRGGRVSGFQVNGNSLSTVCMEVELAVNRSFSDFRIISPGTNGIGLLVQGAQNCNFRDFDIECNSAAGTTGIKVTNSVGSCRFDNYSILEGNYAGVWVTQTDSGAQYGIGYPEPRYITFDNGIIEHGDPSTACAMRIHSGRDIWVTRQQMFVATDQASSGVYTIVEINDAGAGTTSMLVFDKGSVSGGAVTTQLNGGVTLPQATITVDSTSGFGDSGTFEVDGNIVTYTGKTATTFTGCTGGSGAVADDEVVTQKESTAFDIQSGSSTYRTRIADYSFGNNRFGVVAAASQTVEVDNYRGPSTDTMFSGAGTIISREFGATAYS